MSQVPMLTNVEVGRLLGEGGFGFVYEGVIRDEQQDLEMPVAIKALKNSKVDDGNENNNAASSLSLFLVLLSHTPPSSPSPLFPDTVTPSG